MTKDLEVTNNREEKNFMSLHIQFTYAWLILKKEKNST